MTLIVSYADPLCVIQLSDRRLSFVYSDDRVRYEDTFNKAVIHRHNCTIAFTGLAKLGTHRRAQMTDDWIAQTISRDDVFTIGDVTEVLEREATIRFRSLALPDKDKRTTIVITGWTGQSDTMAPTRTYITNYLLNPATDMVLPKARERFWHMTKTIAQDRFDITTFGCPVSNAMISAVTRQVRALHDSGAGYEAVTCALAEIILKTAEMSVQTTVSKTMNIVCLPNPQNRKLVKVGPRYLQLGVVYRLPNPSDGYVSVCSIPLDQEQIAPQTVAGSVRLSQGGRKCVALTWNSHTFMRTKGTHWTKHTLWTPIDLPIGMIGGGCFGHQSPHIGHPPNL